VPAIPRRSRHGGRWSTALLLAVLSGLLVLSGRASAQSDPLLSQQWHLLDPGIEPAGANVLSVWPITTAMARAHGADAVMVAPPAGAKNLDAVAEYYQAVMRAAACPLVLQDEPVTTQVTMPAPFLVRLIGELPAVEAVKLEEAPTLPKITRLRELASRRVAIFGGLGGVYFFEELSRGADGAMTGFPYPEALHAIREHFMAGRREQARALFYRWLPLIRYESQPGAQPGSSIAIRKEIFRRRGWIASARVRPPAAALDPATLAELTELLAAVAPSRSGSTSPA